MPRKLLRGAAIVLGALLLGIGAGAVWTDLTQGNPGQGQPQPTLSPSP